MHPKINLTLFTHYLSPHLAFYRRKFILTPKLFTPFKGSIMNKKAYLVLLAIAAQQSSMMAAWNWKKQNTQQQDPSTPQNNIPAMQVSNALSTSYDYRLYVQATLQEIYAEAKRSGNVDISHLESTIIAEHAPAILEPGTKALQEAEEQSEKEIAELRSKNETLEEKLLWIRGKALMAVVGALVIGGVIGSCTK